MDFPKTYCPMVFSFGFGTDEASRFLDSAPLEPFASDSISSFYLTIYFLIDCYLWNLNTI